MHRNLGRAVGVALALAVLPGLSACTPEDRPALAVTYADGQPTLLIENCDGSRIDSVNLHGAADRVWRIRAGSAAGPEQIRLLQAPDGWTTTEDTLTGFEPGVQYRVTAFPDGNGGTVPVPFTLDQLRRLEAGQVVVGDVGTTSHVVSEEDYRAEAKDSC